MKAGRGGWLGAAFVAELAAVYLWRLPLLYNFNNFAFWDCGGYLVAHDLLKQGLRPGIDFGWQYGLLPLLVQEACYAMAGATPGSFLLISAIVTVWFALALGQIAAAGGGRERLLVAAALPFITELGADLPHILEAALLATAILSQLRGRYRAALGLATAAVFTKPTMGYLYGAILVAIVGIECERTRRAGQARLTEIVGRVGRELLPAALVGVVLVTLLGARFGAAAVATTLLPSAGAQAYHVLHLGIFDSGSRFLYLPGATLGYYFGTPVVFWIAGTAALVAASAIALGGHVEWGRRFAVMVSCTIMHLGFIGVFFGGPASWQYYAYVLVSGLVMAGGLAGWRLITLVLCGLAVLANVSWIENAAAGWRRMVRSPETAGLYAPAAELAEWAQLRAAAGGERVVVSSWIGAAGRLCPWVEREPAAFLVPGVATAGDLAREHAALSAATWIIAPNIPGMLSLAEWPAREFASASECRQEVFHGRYFVAWRTTGETPECLARAATRPKH
ncbi:MAG TPA: hypothetical protein VFB15_06970 [Candidatus Binataceae bacterium]|nr:hypothetical protein [Candidatus Binataceae bacterium]